MGILMKIHNVKSIKDFLFEIPDEKGLYAITGENASGKSTVISSIATSFYNPVLNSYFGQPYNGSMIEFDYNGRKRIVNSQGNSWFKPKGKLQITGFFEGSIVYGNRFKDVNFGLLEELSKVTKGQLAEASNFVKENLGMILHDNENYYQNLYVLKKEFTKEYGLVKPLFYYETDDRLVNQLNMSTGENLLLTILYSIQNRLSKIYYGDEPSFVLLDEIELALHSSALRRLVNFLKKLAEENNFVVLFSTHSIEIIRNLPPQNIYYLQRHVDKSIELINPCYPVYATRSLESSSFGYDFVIMVEDDLAKKIVDRILKQNELLGNKRVLVLAVGGWTQVLKFAFEANKSGLLQTTTKVLIVLDRDIKSQVGEFLRNEKIGFSVQPNYLPVQSLEKYLLKNLVDKVDHTLFRKLNDYVFQMKSLDEIVSEYAIKVKNGEFKDAEAIKNGKQLMAQLRHALGQMRKEESVLVNEVVEYLFEKKNKDLAELSAFLTEQLKSTKKC